MENFFFNSSPELSSNFHLTSNNGANSGHVKELINLELWRQLLQLLTLFDPCSRWQEVKETLEHAKA